MVFFGALLLALVEISGTCLAFGIYVNDLTMELRLSPHALFFASITEVFNLGTILLILPPLLSGNIFVRLDDYHESIFLVFVVILSLDEEPVVIREPGFHATIFELIDVIKVECRAHTEEVFALGR